MNGQVKRYVFYYNQPNYLIDTDGVVFKFVDGVDGVTNKVKNVGSVTPPKYYKGFDDYKKGICPIDGIIYSDGRWEC